MHAKIDIAIFQLFRFLDVLNIVDMTIVALSFLQHRLRHFPLLIAQAAVSLLL